MEKNRAIFNKKLLERSIANYSFGNLSEKIMIIKKWFEFYEKGVMDKSKETVLQGDFLTDFFGKILGYKNRLDSNEEWTMDKETKTKADETRADGALGYFSQNKTEIKAVIELKDSKTNLDERQHRLNDRRTPIEQAFSYSFKSGKSCNWVIVSNYKEIRVYNAKDSNEYEVFHISNLENENELKKFIYLLSYETLISRQKESIVDILYRINTEAEKEITSKFYKDYKKLRENLFNQIKEKNQEIEEIIIFEKTQKLLDRFIFVCFCEDTGLLGERTIRKLVARAKERLSRSETKIWDEMKDLFIAIDMGSPAHNINKFNGGLFAEDKIIDSFTVEDKIFEELALISDYDFASDLNVNILGHIFEQSLNDLEEIKARINGEEFDEKKGKRKKDGIFYTPEYITKYIVEQAVGGWLEDRKRELGFYELSELTDDDRKAVYKSKKSDERVYSQNSLKHLEFWQKYKLVLANIKVLDPACGSGAFLNQAFDFLFSEGQRVNKAIADLRGIYSFEDLTAGILKNNIYGVDLNEESVEITKLSLWLKTANRNDPLTTLDNNIKCGNSLIDDEEVAGKKAFKWEEEFKEIMDNGGFDVVIGNPPYVNIANISSIKEREFYKNNYETVKNKSDLYSIFTEKSYKVLKEKSYFGFIFSNSWMGTDSFSKFREFLIKNTMIFKLVKLPLGVFEEATVTTIILFFKKEVCDKNYNIDLVECQEKGFINKNYKLSYERILNTANKTFSFEKAMIIKKETVKLGNIGYFSLGIKTSNDEKFILKYKKDEDTYRMLRGRNIDRYLTKISEEYIWYKPELMSEKVGAGPRKIEYFIVDEKILFQGISGGNIKAVIDKEKYLVNDKIHILYRLDKYSFSYILALINSRLMDIWVHATFNDLLEIKINQLQELPIAIPTEEQEKEVSEKADKMLELNKSLLNISSKFISYISDKWKFEKVSGKIEEFYLYDFATLLKELKKQKIVLQGMEEYSLKEIFDSEKAKIEELKKEIEKTDKEIDKMVYELYGLTDEEIAIIEG